MQIPNGKKAWAIRDITLRSSRALYHVSEDPLMSLFSDRGQYLNTAIKLMVATWLRYLWLGTSICSRKASGVFIRVHRINLDKTKFIKSEGEKKSAKGEKESRKGKKSERPSKHTDHELQRLVKSCFQICQWIFGSYVKPNEITNSDHFVLTYTDCFGASFWWTCDQIMCLA